MQSGSPGFGGPESSFGLLASGQLARRYRLPWRSGGGSLTTSPLPDAQAAYEGTNTMLSAFLAGANLVMHTGGWLEGGLVASFEKLVIDLEIVRTLRAEFTQIEVDEASLAFDAHVEVGQGGHFLGAAHTLERFRTCFYRPLVSTTENFERWTRNGAKDTARGRASWSRSCSASTSSRALDDACARRSTSTSTAGGASSATDVRGRAIVGDCWEHQTGERHMRDTVGVSLWASAHRQGVPLHNRLSLILSALALVVSLTGVSAFAASQINGATIKNHSITANKLTQAAISQLHGAQGAQGEPGYDGLPGSTGAPGVPGRSRRGRRSRRGGRLRSHEGQLRDRADEHHLSRGTVTVSASCAPGSKVVGGGYFSSINDVAATEPDVYGGTRWWVIVQNSTSIATNAWAYAVCVAA